MKPKKKHERFGWFTFKDLEPCVFGAKRLNGEPTVRVKDFAAFINAYIIRRKY